MGVTECFLCSKKLVKHTHPRTLEAAQLYSQTLVKVLSYDNGSQAQVDQQQQLSDVEQFLDTSTCTNSENIDPIVMKKEDILGKKLGISADSDLMRNRLIQVTYCSACVQTVRRLHITFKQLERLQLQILECKTKIVNQLILNCNENDNLFETATDPESNFNSLRNIIVQEFQLRKWINFQGIASDSNIASSSSKTSLQLQRSQTVRTADHNIRPVQWVHVRLTRLEEIPEFSRYFERATSGRVTSGNVDQSIYRIKLEPITNTSRFHLDDVCSDTPDDNYEARSSVEEPAGAAGIIGNCGSTVLGLESELNTNDCNDDDDDYCPSPVERHLESDSEYRPTSKLKKTKLVSDDPTTKIKNQKTSRNYKKKKSGSGLGNANRSSSNKFPCEFDGCDFKSESESLTILHIREVHKVLTKGYSCNIFGCGADFFREESLQFHVSGHTYKHPCKYCDKGFAKYSLLRKHFNRYHNVNRVLLSCTSCSYKTDNRSHLLEHHQGIHTKEKSFMCQHCGLSFKYSQRLKYHLGSKHAELNPGTESLYKCQHCNKIYADPPSLRRHIRSGHLNQWKLHCEICGQGVNSQGKLKIHMSKHTGERNYECNICHAKFKGNSGFINHMRRHTGEFKHTCSVCSKNFASSGALKRHEQIHAGVVKHFCPHCNKGFPVRNYLYIHLRSHESKEERAERKKKTESRNPEPLHKLYNDLRKSNSTVASVVIDPEFPETTTSSEAYPMIYDYTRNRQPQRNLVEDSI